MRTFLMLSGVAGFALALQGCATTHAEPARTETVGEVFDDAGTTTAVNGLILGDPDAHFFKIEVTTTRGAVLLQGRVNSRQTEGRLVAKVKGLRGVHSVRSVLTLEEHSSRAE